MGRQLQRESLVTGGRLRVGIFTVRDLSVAGGSLMRIVGTTQHLQENGCQVDLFAPTFTSQLEGRVRYVPLAGACRRHGLSSTYVAYPTLLAPLKLMRSDSALAALIRGQGIDVIHAHQHPAGVRLLKIADRIGIPIILDVHGILGLQADDHRAVTRNPLYVPYLLRMERNLFRGVDALFVRTESERAYIGRQFGVAAERIHIVPDATDVEFLGSPVSAAELAAFGAELGLDAKRIILFGGEFKAQSGLLDLVEAYGLLKARRPDVALLLLGDGMLMPRVEETIQRTGLSDVVLLGRQPRERLRLCQQLADVVVTPEIQSVYNELALPLKLLDCLASGRPAVATRIACHASIIEDGVNGFLVQAGDPVDMAAGLERALDAGPDGDVARRGRATVRERYSWRQSAQEAERAYRTVVALARSRAASGRRQR